MEVRKINGKVDAFKELLPIAKEANTPEGFKKRINFTNSLDTTLLDIARALKNELPEGSHFRKQIATFTSTRSQ